MRPAIRIRPASDFAVDAALLPPGERALIPPAGGRRDEWIRGRLAMRAVLVELLGGAAAGIEIRVAPDAGPLVVGGPPCAVSLSHDRGWIAVAAALGAWQIGIDLCAPSHAPRVIELLAQLRVHHDCEPVAAWVALEAVLKLRRWPLLELREHALAVIARDATRVDVRGLGAPVEVVLETTPDHVVGWTIERANSDAR